MTVSTAITIDGAVPSEPQYTLKRLADATPLADPHWRAGVLLLPYPGAPEATDASPSLPPGFGLCDPDTVEFHDMPDWSEHEAFVIYKAVTCTTRLFTPNELIARVKASFSALVHQTLEDQFWNGTILDTTPYLTDGTAQSLGSSLGVVAGWGALDAQALKLGGDSMIHCSPEMAAAAASHNLLRVDGRILRTVAGNTMVVPAGGYDGSAPSGGTANSGQKEYAFVTDKVHVVSGDVISYPDAANPEGGVVYPTNDAEALVQQEWITLYDPDRTYTLQIDRAA